MTKYTERQLYDFINRIDSEQKVNEAERWFKVHYDDVVEKFGVDAWDDMMSTVAYISRELNRELTVVHNPRFCPSVVFQEW